MGKDVEEQKAQQQEQRIRVTLNSANVKSIEKGESFESIFLFRTTRQLFLQHY